MAVIIVNGCFDVFHEGHRRFLAAVRNLGLVERNHLIVAINSDNSAKRLKGAKWGAKYPIDSWDTRAENVSHYADTVVKFDDEEELRTLIKSMMPCLLVKGPDYAGKSVTGEDIAPVLILFTPEPESVKKMKQEVYGAP